MKGKAEYIYNNLGKFIHTFNEIELFINLIIAHHIEPKDRKFFLEYILNTSVIGFGSKIKILINLNIFNKSQIKKIRDYSSNRNVFAHSNINDSVDIEETSPNKITINVTDVILKTNSDGKVTEVNYNTFIKDHVSLQNEIIDFISEYIITNNIDTHYNHIENLNSLK